MLEMKSVALRFAENFSPEIGTIKSHEAIISKFGFVYYGKLGSPISNKVRTEVLNEKYPKILLIHSGASERYWAYVENIQNTIPDLKYVPNYYHDKATGIKCWIKIKKFEIADKGIMSRCIVSSSKKSLSEASKYSMSPYFIIEFDE